MSRTVARRGPDVSLCRMPDTDIVGGLAAGLGTVLVTDHRLLKGFDWKVRAARADIFPDHVIPEA